MEEHTNRCFAGAYYDTVQFFLCMDTTANLWFVDHSTSHHVSLYFLSWAMFPYVFRYNFTNIIKAGLEQNIHIQPTYCHLTDSIKHHYAGPTNRRKWVTKITLNGRVLWAAPKGFVSYNSVSKRCQTSTTILYIYTYIYIYIGIVLYMAIQWCKQARLFEKTAAIFNDSAKSV